MFLILDNHKTGMKENENENEHTCNVSHRFNKNHFGYGIYLYIDTQVDDIDRRYFSSIYHMFDVANVCTLYFCCWMYNVQIRKTVSKTLICHVFMYNVCYKFCFSCIFFLFRGTDISIGSIKLSSSRFAYDIIWLEVKLFD